MPSFWSDTFLEPKRKYRFKLLMEGQQPYVVTKVKNPAVKISETPHKFLNHTFYYPGRVEWEPIDISFVDPSGPDDQSGRLFTALKDSGYANPTTDQLALEGNFSMSFLQVFHGVTMTTMVKKCLSAVVRLDMTMPNLQTYNLMPHKKYCIIQTKLN